MSARSRKARPRARRLATVLASIGALLLSVLAGRALLQRAVARQIAITSEAGVQSLEQLRLGGVRQWIQIRGHDRSKPVLLFLHGGPGFPQMPFGHQNAALEKEFVIVQWDQRGAGKSYAGADASMRIDQFVSDAHELVQLLLRRFGREKCYLAAHSWGSILGTRLVVSHPELFSAYVALGQVVQPPESERVRYRFALTSAERENEVVALRELRAAGPPPYPTFQNAEILDRWVLHYARAEYQPIARRRFVWLALQSPAYTWVDLLRIPLGARSSFAQLWREAFYDVNLFEQVPTIDVPVFFFQGRHDLVVTTEVTQRYFEMLDAPRGKQIIWFEASGHWPHFKEPAKFRSEMINIVR